MSPARIVLWVRGGVARAITVTLLALSLLSVPFGVAACAQSADVGDDAIAAAFAERRSDVQVTGEGTVVRLLADDKDGSRHQRFIIELASGQTLLVSHNIDLAPGIDALATGDIVAFCGVYEYNEQGGLVHWTHHDPDGQHEPGWIEYEGRRYE